MKKMALERRLVSQIRKEAERQGIPLSHLPDRAGLSRSHFWAVLGLERSPTLGWIGRIAEVLQADVCELLREEEDVPPGEG